MWRLEGSAGRRWVQWDGPGQVSGQPKELLFYVDPGLARPVEIATMSGEFYTPTDPDDPIAIFLRARDSVGGDAVVTGEPPEVPLAAGNEPGVIT